MKYKSRSSSKTVLFQQTKPQIFFLNTHKRPISRCMFLTHCDRKDYQRKKVEINSSITFKSFFS